MPFSITYEQSNQIFEIFWQKAEEEKVAATEKTAFEKKLMKKELNACIAAATIAAVAATTIAANANTGILAPRKVVGEKDDIINEVPPKVTNISLCFAGLPKDKIVRIFYNNFKAINLYRLWHMQGFRYKAFQDQERIGIEDGMVWLRKILGLYKDFRKLLYDVWGEAFINYTTILVFLFGKEVLDLHAALWKFYRNIFQLSNIYKW